MQILDRIVSKVGRRIDETSPMCDARLPDGSRVNAIIPPLALDGPSLTESLRHGVTTIFMGSCSLSTIHVDPATAGDLFGRVEAIPRRFVINTLRR